jgi:small subunit ribosomal protein S1
MEQEKVGKESTRTTMGDLLNMEGYDYLRPQRGDIRQGVILSIEGNQIVVDIGVKQEAFVSPRELERMGEEDWKSLSVGNEVPVYIVKPEDREGNLIVSMHLARIHQDWVKAQELLENNEIFEAQVTGYNKGGLVVPFGKIRAFIPASQIGDFPRNPTVEQKASRLATYVGRSLPVRAIEVDRHRRRLILSQRAAQKEWREKQRERLINTLKEGDIVHGTVSSLVNFGAFVDLGGVDGLIHVSELSWQRVKHPREVLQVGDEVDTYVLRVDRENKRIGLSLRRLRPNPWTLVDDKYSVDQLVEATITNVTDFGAFARLEEGIEGLIHASELVDEDIAHPSAVVQRDNAVLLKVIKVDGQRQRIGLSLKQVTDEERDSWLKRQAAQEETGGQDRVEKPGRAVPEKSPDDLAEETAGSADIVAEAVNLAEMWVEDDRAEEAVPEVVSMPPAESVSEGESPI